MRALGMGPSFGWIVRTAHTIFFRPVTLLLGLAALAASLPSSVLAQQVVWGHDGSPDNTVISHSLAAFDSKGGIVTVGSGYTSEHPLGQVEPVHNPAQIATRLAPNGSTRWTSIYSPISSSHAWITIDALLLDSADNVYTAGTLYSPSSSGGPNMDFAIQKLDSFGNRLWSARFGADDSLDVVTGLALDGSGGVIATGTSDVVVGDSVRRAIQTVRYDAQGRQVWASTHAAPATGEQAEAIVSDGSGGAYVVGSPQPGQSGRPIVIRYGANGAVLWQAQPTPGPKAAEPDHAKAIAAVVDKLGSLYVCVNALDGPSGYTVVKYDMGGRQLWSKEEKALDPSGAYLVASSMALDTRGGVAVGATVYNGPSAYVVAKFRADGRLMWDRSSMSSAGETLVSSGLCVDASGHVYVTGLSVAANGGDFRQATVKFSGAGKPLWRFDHAGAGGPNPYYDQPSITVGHLQNIAVSWVTQHAAFDQDPSEVVYIPATYLLR